MAERVGNPVPPEIRARLDRGERPLVYELVTRPKRQLDAVEGTWAERFAEVIGTDDQHELLLTAQRLAVVTTERRKGDPELVLSVPRDQVVTVEPAGSGLERGRIRFDFRDGSQAHGVMGLVMPRPARRFLEAYSASTPGTSERRRP